MKGRPTWAALINLYPWSSVISNMYWDFVCEWDCSSDIHY